LIRASCTFWVNFGCLYAADRGHRATTIFLHNALSEIPIEALTRYNGMQILGSAIRHSWPDVVDEVISKHRRDNNTLANKVSSGSSGSYTTLGNLVTAAKLGNIHVMERLLRAGVPDIEPSALGGVTPLLPLHSATVQGHPDAMRLLLDWGADPRDASSSCHVGPSSLCAGGTPACTAGLMCILWMGGGGNSPTNLNSTRLCGETLRMGEDRDEMEETLGEHGGGEAYQMVDQSPREEGISTIYQAS
jgi:hypothetical protein